MHRRSTIITFSTSIVIVMTLQILLPYSGLGKIILNGLFIWGFLGLVFINILLFAIPLCVGLINMNRKRTSGKSKEQEDQENEKELKRLLYAENVTEEKMPRWANIGITVCIGIIAGSVLGFVLNRTFI